MEFFLTPSIKPVEIVVPERERPGNTARAWDRPIINASLYPTSFPGSRPSDTALRACLLDNVSETKSSTAVSKSILPTIKSPEPKTAST